MTKANAMATKWERIVERYVGDVVVLELSAFSVCLCESRGRLFASIQKQVNRGSPKIVLNLLGVTIIDSEGLGEIVRGHQHTEAAGGTLKLCGVSSRMRDLLVTTKLDRCIGVFDSEREAIDSFAAHR